MEENIVIISSSRYNLLPNNFIRTEYWTEKDHRINEEIGLIDVRMHKEGGIGRNEYALKFDTAASMTMFMMQEFDAN